MTASMKMMVSEASRMFSAISFGVFCRLAPSTRAIIRSMNVSPGLEVILTTIRSDSTVVPPVTADLSPPDSRMTGADSPRSEEHTSELQSLRHLVCRLLLEKKKKIPERRCLHYRCQWYSAATDHCIYERCVVD